MKRQVILFLAGIITLSACSSEDVSEGQSTEGDPPAASYSLKQEGLSEVLDELDSNEEVLEHYAMCPADIFGTVRAYKDRSSIKDDHFEACSQNPMACLKKCLDDDDGPFCQSLAFVLEDNESSIDARYGRMMYAQACASGWPLSCTNRGAGIRNAMIESDPFASKDEGEIDECLAISFETTCEAGDAWGCFMVADSLSRGEGASEDGGAALKYLKRACELDKESGACILGE